MKLIKAFQKHPAELVQKINDQEDRIRELETELEMAQNELALETAWAEGEIDFWQDVAGEEEAKADMYRQCAEDWAAEYEKLAGPKMRIFGVTVIS